MADRTLNIQGKSREDTASGSKRQGNKDQERRISLVGQWLRVCTPNAGGMGSIPGREVDPTYHN